jgi:alpha-mannosidase
MWYGLDGTGVLTHFSPADTYTATASVRDVSYAVRNNKDKEYSNRSLLVYGFGDGGGGPRDEMLRRIEKMSHIEGLPASVKFGDPTQFYRDLESTSKDLNSWKGELYFELHRGTYTTHGLIKKGNRKGELALRALEIMSSLACIKSASFSNPKDELDKLWKLLLLYFYLLFICKGISSTTYCQGLQLK